jgi:hypothetical protein
LVQGQAYTLYISNFPRGSSVALQLKDSKGGDVGSPVQIRDFEDDGVEELPWTVPEDLPVGDYYFHASQAKNPAIHGFSPAFGVLAE